MLDILPLDLLRETLEAQIQGEVGQVSLSGETSEYLAPFLDLFDGTFLLSNPEIKPVDMGFQLMGNLSGGELPISLVFTQDNDIFAVRFETEQPGLTFTTLTGLAS